MQISNKEIKILLMMCGIFRFSPMSLNAYLRKQTRSLPIIDDQFFTL